MDNENFLWIDDIGQAAALAVYHPIQGIRLNILNSRRVQFAFNNTAESLQDAEMYSDGTLQVGALTFYTELLRLRGKANNLIPKNN